MPASHPTPSPPLPPPSRSPLHARAVLPALPGGAGALQRWLRRLTLLVRGGGDGHAAAAGEQVIHAIGAGLILSFPAARMVLVLLGRGRRRRVGVAGKVRCRMVPVRAVRFAALVEVEELPRPGTAARQPGRSQRRPGAAGGRGGAAAAAARPRGGEAGALGAGLHRRAGGRGRHRGRLLQPPPSLAAAVHRRRGAGGGHQSGQQRRGGRRGRRRRGRGAAAAAGSPEPGAAVATGRRGGGGRVQRRGVEAEVVREGAAAAAAPHALRGLPDLHPERIRGAFLLGLDPGHAGIHPRPPARLRPSRPGQSAAPPPAHRAAARLSAPGPERRYARAGSGGMRPGEASTVPARRCPERSPRRSNVASPSPEPEPALRMPRRF